VTDKTQLKCDTAHNIIDDMFLVVGLRDWLVWLQSTHNTTPTKEATYCMWQKNAVTSCGGDRSNMSYIQLPLKNRVASHPPPRERHPTGQTTFKHPFQQAAPHNECLLEIEYSAALDFVLAAPKHIWIFAPPFFFILKKKSGSVTEADKKNSNHATLPHVSYQTWHLNPFLKRHACTVGLKLSWIHNNLNQRKAPNWGLEEAGNALQAAAKQKSPVRVRMLRRGEMDRLNTLENVIVFQLSCSASC